MERRSATAFDDLYRQWFHDVCRWARALGGLDADVEDIAQEVFLVARRKLGGFDGQHPRAWLYSITRRAVSDYRRRAWFRRVLQPLEALLDAPSSGPSPSEIAGKNEAARALTEILNRLSPVRRTAFILFEIEGYSGEEIAELEGIPLNTVYTRLHHARKDFMDQVAKHRQSQGESACSTKPGVRSKSMPPHCCEKSAPSRIRTLRGPVCGARSSGDRCGHARAGWVASSASSCSVSGRLLRPCGAGPACCPARPHRTCPARFPMAVPA
jgi:RNA polymerase sigma-70 factor (ECF subfamily)